MKLNNWIKVFVYPMIFLLLISTLGLIVLAGSDAVKGAKIIYSGKAFTEIYSGAGVYFLLMIDLVLGAVVSLVLMIGLGSLFEVIDKTKLQSLPDWIHITTFGRLKILIWETVLLAMVVYFFILIFKSHGEYEWTFLVLPGSVFLLSAGLYFVKKNHGKH